MSDSHNRYHRESLTARELAEIEAERTDLFVAVCKVASLIGFGVCIGLAIALAMLP